MSKERLIVGSTKYLGFDLGLIINLVINIRVESVIIKLEMEIAVDGNCSSLKIADTQNSFIFFCSQTAIFFNLRMARINAAIRSLPFFSNYIEKKPKIPQNCALSFLILSHLNSIYNFFILSICQIGLAIRKYILSK